MRENDIMNLKSWKDVYDYSEGHSVKWMRCGPAFFSHLNLMISKAESTIHFQVYLIDADSTGNLLLDELMKAARRGVEVNLVVDDFGAGKLGKPEEIKLIDAGVKFKRFEPYLSSNRFYVGRRMHHKVLVVDEKIAMVGGMNIADRYHGTPTSPPWLDYAIIVQGPVCSQLARSCKKILERQFIPTAPKWPNIIPNTRRLDPEKVWARVRKNDWLRNRGEITKSYNKAVRLATQSITIVGGYFLPGRRFLRLLSNASKRGVEINIILTRFSDVPVVKNASEYLYGKLLNNKIRIYESKESMVHGKVAVVDGIWSTIGSYNQNHLSAYLSIELNIDVVNHEFSKNFNDHLKQVIKDECLEITRDSFYSNSGVYSKVKRWVSYRLVRLSLRMLFVVNRIFTVND